MVAVPENIDAATYIFVRRALVILLIVLIGYLACNMVRLVAVTLLRSQKLDAENNLHAKIAHTQVLVFQRLCYGFISVVCAACIIFSFPAAWQVCRRDCKATLLEGGGGGWPRQETSFDAKSLDYLFPVQSQVGASLLASAGLMGLIVAASAKPILENVFCSLVIALTRPILLDDEVVIDGEHGRVEGIQSMFVIVRTWDARRLIVPLSKIISTSFENWSQRSPWKIGSVFLYLDPAVPVSELRKIFTESVLPASGGMWDGKVGNCDVTEITKDGAVEVRFAASAKDGGMAFDLRCFVRERMVEEVVARWGADVLCRRKVDGVPVGKRWSTADVDLNPPSVVDRKPLVFRSSSEEILAVTEADLERRESRKERDGKETEMRERESTTKPDYYQGMARGVQHE